MRTLFIIVAIIIIFLWVRWMRCKAINGACSFFTLTPLEPQQPGNPPQTVPDGSSCTINGHLGIVFNGTCHPIVLNAYMPHLSSNSSLLGKSIKVIQPAGINVFDIDANGCPAVKNPPVSLPKDTISTILEVKYDYAGCPSLPAGTLLTLIRIKEGWLYYVKGKPWPISTIQII